MSITYPTTIDSLTNPSSTDTLDSPSHAGQHSDLNDAVEALETKVGADSSVVTSSLDYKVTNTSSSNPGHKHTLANGATDVTSSADELNKLDGLTADYTDLNQLDGVTVGGTGSGDIATIDDTQTLTNKTLTTPTLTTPTLTTPKVDTISEETSAAGVTVDGVLLKDYSVVLADATTKGNFVGFNITLDDDTATSVTPSSQIGVILIYGRSASYDEFVGIFSYRTSTTGFVISITSYAGFETSTSVLSGTTGTDAKITISAVAADDKIYIENRRGGATSLGIVLLGN